MTRTAGTILFISIIFSIYFLMNWYVLGRFAGLLSIKRCAVFYFITILMTLSLLIGVSLNGRFANTFVWLIYKASTMWFGICWVSLWVLLILHAASHFLKLEPRLWAMIAVSIVACITLYANIMAKTIIVRSLNVPGPVSMRIAHLTDLHIGSNGGRFLKGVIEKTNRLNPDLVLITGDLFDDHNRYSFENTKLLNGLNAPVFMSAGNHEQYVNFDNVAKMLEPTKVTWLRNEALDFKGIRLIGINNSYHWEFLDVILNELGRADAFTILMYHQPVGFNIAARSGIHLMLSGHTHSGQIWPFNFVVKRFYPYLVGTYKLGDSVLNVGSGTGTWGPRMRLGTRSEITLIEIRQP